jgi:hypothetical protein
MKKKTRPTCELKLDIVKELGLKLLCWLCQQLVKVPVELI